MRFPLLIAGPLGVVALAACGSSYASNSSPTSAPVQSAPVTTRPTSLGNVLADSRGLTLYGLTKDAAGTPTCVDACANAWPPLIVSGTIVPAGLDSKVFSVVSRPDGSHQLKAGKWPLYRFAGDSAAGDANGQGSAGVWFVVEPSGALNKS